MLFRLSSYIKSSRKKAFISSMYYSLSKNALCWTIRNITEADIRTLSIPPVPLKRILILMVGLSS